MISIVAQFMLDEQKNQNTDRHPDRKPQDIDKDIQGVFLCVSKNNLEVVLEHGRVGYFEKKFDLN